MLEPPVTPIRKANDGLELPATGFGTYKVNGLAGVDAIKSAIHQGYRLIDSAFNYENEGVVGRAIRESGVPREDIIVTSKLPGRHHAHDEALLTIEESVCRMGLDYIDLYLIHWPNPSQGQFVEAWEALVEARERGLVKHIGVSNFLPGHIDLLIRDAARPGPEAYRRQARYFRGSGHFALAPPVRRRGHPEVLEPGAPASEPRPDRF